MGEWTNGLFGCVSDIGTTIRTCFCPCVTAGKNAEAMGQNCCLFGCLSTCACVTFFSRAYIRGMVRDKYEIQGAFVKDLLYHVFCPFCSLIQEASEITAHDPNAPADMAMARS